MSVVNLLKPNEESYAPESEDYTAEGGYTYVDAMDPRMADPRKLLKLEAGMLIAISYQYLSTCQRKAVGCAITRDGRVISTGYNGSAPGTLHCKEVGCDVVRGHCVRCIHAEMNAISFAAKHGQITQDSILYTTSEPCLYCAHAIVAAGIREVIFISPYRVGGELGGKFLVESGVNLLRAECYGHR